MKVIGIAERSGEFNGKAWHNINIHCTYNDDNAIGELTKIVKVKAAISDEVFSTKVDTNFLRSLIGKNIRVYYNQYGNVDMINLVGDK